MNRRVKTTTLRPIERACLHALGLLVSLGIFWGNYSFIIRPSIEQQDLLVAEQGRLEMLRQSHSRVLQSHQEIGARLDSKTRSVHSLLNQIGYKTQANVALQTLTDCAKQSNATIISMRPTPPRQGESCMIQTTRLSLRCNYSSLCEFLSSLHASGEPFWVVELELNCRSGDANAPGYGVRGAELTVHLPHTIHTHLLDHLPQPSNVAATQAPTAPEA